MAKTVSRERMLRWLTEFQEVVSELESLQKRRVRLERRRELYDRFVAMGGERFPSEYLDDEALGFIFQAVQTRRADSIRAAVALFEDHLAQRAREDAAAAHRARTERHQRAMAMSSVLDAWSAAGQAQATRRHITNEADRLRLRTRR